ncbi:E3 ubiquitin-protein ligase TRIM33-like isoform X2 [Antedon mediterranea]
MAAPETTGPVPQLYCGKCKTELTFSTKKQLPQYLCCLHTICYNCIQEIAAANKGSTSECPVCFVPFDETNTKDVFFLKDLSFSQKVVNFINGKDFSIECQNCIEETASAYCQKCEYPQFYCEECITAHDRLRLNLHHKSRSLDDMKEKGIYPNVNRPSVGLCECSDTVLTHFCRLCQQPACTKCSETDHSDHKPFVVEIYAASKEIREELVNKQLQLQNKVDILKTREKHIKYEHSRLLNSYIKTAENMTRFFDEIRGCVGEREAALHKQLMDAVDIKIKAFDIDGESTKKEIHVNNQKSEFLKCVNQYGDDIDIVTSLQTVDDQCDFTKAANEEPIDNGSIQFRVGDVTPFNENLQESVNTTDFYIKQIPKVFSNLGVIKRTTTVASLSYATLDIAGREIR